MTNARNGPLCIFAKPPTAGLSKTRLGRTIGMVQAAQLAQAFLQDTAAVASRGERQVVLATTDVEGRFGVPSSIPRWQQGPGDLGNRVERIFQRALESADWVIALGADSPGLAPEVIDRAVRELQGGAPAVLGPSRDGGFYLLGVRRCPHGLLSGLPWSRPDTASATCARLAANQMTPVLLPEWFDIDEAVDLERFRREVPRERAPRTWAALDLVG